jgi:hypothetical protein
MYALCNKNQVLNIFFKSEVGNDISVQVDILISVIHNFLVFFCMWFSVPSVNYNYSSYSRHQLCKDTNMSAYFEEKNMNKCV